MQEIMIGCMQGVMICLSRDLRMAYILGEISNIKSHQCAAILNIKPEAFRKRISRARQELRHFLNKKCGLVNPDNPCRCSRYVRNFIKDGALDRNKLLFTGLPCHQKKAAITARQLDEMDQLQRMIALFRSQPDYVAPNTFVNTLKALVASGNLH